MIQGDDLKVQVQPAKVRKAQLRMTWTYCYIAISFVFIAGRDRPEDKMARFGSGDVRSAKPSTTWMK